jgi:hypothetical protein
MDYSMIYFVAATFFVLLSDAIVCLLHKMVRKYFYSFSLNLTGF